MKTFREFILECELVEGKVEWDNPKRPLQSGMTPREKNRVQRKRLETFKGLGHSGGKSFTSTGPSQRDYERYGGLTLANQEQSGLKTSKEKIHKFKNPKGKDNRKKYAPHVFRNLKEPKESFDYSVIEGIQPLPSEKMLRKIKKKSYGV